MIKSTVRKIVRNAGVGRLHYHLVHRPRSYVGHLPMVVDLQTGNPDIILSTYRAFGDTLLLSAVARALRKHGVDRVAVATVRPELFANNPGIHAIWNKDDWQCKELQQDRIPKLRFCHYSVHTETPGRLESPTEHIIAVMCRQAGVNGKVELLPRIYLSSEEIDKHTTYKERVVVQSSILNAGFPLVNKEWVPSRMQSFVDKINNKFEVVQLGVPNDPPLNGVTDLRGRISIRDAASVLKNSRAFVGMVGFLMHLARAVDCPSVIIYGGREKSWQTGYSCNMNLESQIGCSPCWLESECPYDRECMYMISSQNVIASFSQLLDMPRYLNVDLFDLSNRTI